MPSATPSYAGSPIVFERGPRIYIVGNCSPVTVANPREELAFGSSIVDELRQHAPSEHLAWYGGHYVQGDEPNLNGAMWRGGDLAIKSLTPNLMPVTVMHDPRTAVGMIADAKLYTPDADGVPKAKIETVNAIWAHRFPEVHEEAMHNYKEGTLAQSMEALAPEYECEECGTLYHKLPDQAEEANWCEHLESGSAARVLKNFTFTGTGLIFGTRGAEPADPNASLSAIQDEVAEYHERARHDRGRRPRKRSKTMATIEIEQSEYDRIKSERDSFKTQAETAAAEKTAAEKEAEKAEADKVAAEAAKEKAEAEAKELREKAAEAEMQGERLGKLGADFLSKLGEKTKGRLSEQAGSMSDEDWAERIEELEELVGEKSDAAGSDDDDNAGKDDDSLTGDEIARHQGGGAQRRTLTTPDEVQRRSVVAGL